MLDVEHWFMGAKATARADGECDRKRQRCICDSILNRTQSYDFDRISLKKTGHALKWKQTNESVGWTTLPIRFASNVPIELCARLSPRKTWNASAFCCNVCDNLVLIAGICGVGANLNEDRSESRRWNAVAFHMAEALCNERPTTVVAVRFVAAHQFVIQHILYCDSASCNYRKAAASSIIHACGEHSTKKWK